MSGTDNSTNTNLDFDCGEVVERWKQDGWKLEEIIR
jgi:hypothetical protein